MDSFFFIAVIFMILIAVMAKLKTMENKPGEFPYTKNRMLFSPAERSFLGVLEQAIGDHFRVFGKVRVADVVSVKSMPSKSAWQRAFNSINAKHFDFVLCDKNDFAVACVVELDDKSHRQNNRQKRDAFLAETCQVISLPFVQVQAQKAYQIPEIRTKIMAASGKSIAPAPAHPDSHSSPGQQGPTPNSGVAQ